MSVDIILKDIEWDGVNKIRVPLEGGGTQDFSIGGGVTPTGNINITHSGQTDVTNYATATVPTADANAGSISSSYVTENNQRKWKFTYEGYAESPGWVDEGAFGSPQTYEYNAVPSNTTITPTTSAQTIGGQNYMMEGAVTVSAVPSMTLPATTSSSPTGTNKANILPSTSQRYLNIPSGYNSTAQYYQIIGMDLAPLNVTQNGTYYASTYDVSGFNTVTVNVPTGSNLQTKYATVTPSTSQQIENVRPDSGYDGLERAVVTVEAMPSGEEGTPTLIKRTASANSVSITPKVTNTAGYIPGTTKTGTAMTVSASELVSGTKSITANGTGIDVTNYASVDVNVPSGIGTLLATKSLGTISTSSTTATDTGQTVSVSGINGYDLLIVETSVDTKTNGRHASTMQCIWLTASSTIGTKNGSAIATATMNDKLSSSGTVTSRSNTTKYGIYVYSVSISNGSATLTMYERYNNTQTGTINGSYTTRVYGVNLYNLIGG